MSLPQIWGTSDMEGFAWEKRGLLFSNQLNDFTTHASHPCMVKIDDDLYLLAFSSRRNRQSHIFLNHAKISGDQIQLIGEPKLALAPSKPGYFDSEGLLSCCFVKDKENYYLYYSGWQNIDVGFWQCDTGRAVVKPFALTATREFDGPVLGRDKHNPIFAAATSVMIDDLGIWHTWYNSGISWEKRSEGWWPRYGIHYASSKDGVDWTCSPGLIIPLKDEYEHSFGRPSVIKINGAYHMWFAHRGTKDYTTYRIGYAVSKDGLVWARNDELAGISTSHHGWDSESVCYPYLLEHDGVRFMLYNGNNYGETGFGYAVHVAQQ